MNVYVYNIRGECLFDYWGTVIPRIGEEILFFTEKESKTFYVLKVKHEINGNNNLNILESIRVEVR